MALELSRGPSIDRRERASDDRLERHSGQVPLSLADLCHRNPMAAIPNAIFLSYSAHDEEAAQRICTAMRAAGLDVWFDQNELRGGDAWDASIRRQIKDCALFVPIISASTEMRGEGYFRLEWRLAVERSYLMADDQAFLMPVVIDETPEISARVPDRFRERQWTRLKGGEATPEFVDQVRRALSASLLVTPTSPLRGEPATMTSPPRREPGTSAPVRRGWKWPTAVLGLIATLGLIIAALAMRGGREPPKESAATAAPSNLAAPSPKSIAVLPFQNLTGRAEDAYLAAGLQEEILNALARMRDLKVISRTSASEFHGDTPNVREISQRLGVGSVLEGSIRRDGNALRLTVQLIDARDDRHLLAENYDRDLGHILGLQSAVARKVADALSATLTRYEQGALDRVATNNGDAYNLYLRAVASWRQSTPTDESGVQASKPLLEQALRLDPDYTDALALLSQAHTWNFFDFRQPADGAEAKQAYERALQLDPQLPEARLARGLYQMYVADDLEQALADLSAVVQLRPNSAEAHLVIGFVLRRLGRFDESLQHQRRASDLDPLNPAYGGPILTLIGLRRYPEAIEETKLDQRRFPGHPEDYIVRARITSFMQHSIEPLRQALRDHGDALPPGDRKAVEAEIARAEGRYLDAVKLWAAVPVYDPLVRGERIGLLYWAAGRTEEALRQFRENERDAELRLQRDSHAPNVNPRLAVAQSMLGQHEAALASIDAERARVPESRDPVNGPALSFTRSVILVRAGRAAEGYAEATRLLHVPFSTALEFFEDSDPVLLLVKDDPHYDELIHRPPRL
jgi:TolB-like protein